MKSIVAIALFAVAAAAGAQTVDNDIVNVHQPVAGVVTNPCSGEPVAFEGECHIVSHTRTTPGGATLFNHTNCEGQGLGFLGSNYVFGSESSSHSQTTFACGTSQRLREVTRFISPRSINNFFLYVEFVVTLDENCQPQVEVDRTEAECRGKQAGF